MEEAGPVWVGDGAGTLPPVLLGLVEQMEREGIVGPANHVSKREVLVRRTGEE